MPIFNLSGDQQAVQNIDNQLRNAAKAMKSAYEQVRVQIYQNANFTPDQIYAAFAQYSTTGLTPTQLGESAMAIKALINKFAPSTITDDVPEATITYTS